MSSVLDSMDERPVLFPCQPWNPCQVFHGPDSPPSIAMLPYGDLGLLPDRPSQAKLQELRDAVQKWLTTGAGSSRQSPECG